MKTIQTKLIMGLLIFLSVGSLSSLRALEYVRYLEEPGAFVARTSSHSSTWHRSGIAYVRKIDEPGYHRPAGHGNPNVVYLVNGKRFVGYVGKMPSHLLPWIKPTFLKYPAHSASLGKARSASGHVHAHAYVPKGNIIVHVMCPRSGKEVARSGVIPLVHEAAFKARYAGYSFINSQVR